MKTQRWALGVLLAVTGCGGLVATTEKNKDGSDPSPNPRSTSGNGPSTSATGTGGPTATFTSHVPKSHRPSATDCPSSLDDGGVDGGTTCTSDSECGGTVCECGQDFICFKDPQKNTCLDEGNCLIDSDCGKSGFCSFSTDGAYCGMYRPPGYFCHTPADLCSDDADCPRDDTGPNSCQFMRELGRWQCMAAGP